jgi:8-oxo-dGTP diphosphatase
MRQRVAAKVVIIDDKGRVLILRKSQDDVRHANKSGRYNLPGGKIEPGESLIEGLVREVYEEISVTLDEISAPFFAGEWYPEMKEPLQVVGVFYLCKKWQGDVKLDDEHDHFTWITQSEVADYVLLPPEDKAIEAYFS